MISKLIDFALVVLQLLVFRVYGTFAISKVKLFSFPALKGLKNEILQKTGDLEFHEAYGSENIK